MGTSPLPNDRLKGLVQGRPNLQQIEIFQRADRIFFVGRFYGGPLDEFEIAFLTEGL